MPRKEHEHPLLVNGTKDLVLFGTMAGLAIALAVLVAIPSSLHNVQRYDDAFLRFVLRNRTGWLTGVAKVLNFLGSVVFLLPVRILAAVYLMVRRRWWHATAFIAAIVLSEIVTTVMKSAYDRARPPLSLVHTSGASFPSGHAVATATTAVALVIAFFPTGRQRAIWGTAAAIFSFLMALSRGYLAAHWLSDAIAGTLIGVSCALGPALVVEAIRERLEPEGEHPFGITPDPDAEPPPDPGPARAPS